MRPHGRRTVRLQRQVRYLGLVLGGRPAQALATRLLLRVSKDRFLRIDRHLADDPAFRPRSVGIDDWAWRRGQRYGTLICDLERRRVIDLLPDGNPATVEAWLRDHPQIKVVARDRNGGFGGAVSRALTGAVHVADDWHMLELTRAAFLTAVQKAMPARLWVRQELDPALLAAAERLQHDCFQRRQQTDFIVCQMAQDGTPIKAMVWANELSRKLVRQIVCGERQNVFRVRESSLTRWLSDLEREWATGFRSSRGFIGEWATRQRRAKTTMSIGTGKSSPARKFARLCEPWSNGQTEGQINRLKALKRQIYGHAGIDLLKARLVDAA